MRIAIATENGQVAAHFGRCPEFTLVDIENDAVQNREVLANPGHVPGLIPRILNEQGAKVIVAGGMGQRAVMLFGQENIKTVVGITGPVDNVIEQLLAGTLTGGESLCKPGAGKGTGLEKSECDHPAEDNCNH